MAELTFGDYLIRIVNNHATIRRRDNQRVEPTFYEMQHMKCLAFGGAATAVEVFPAHRDLVDGEHQRHLWLVDRNTVPNLATSQDVENEL